MGHCFAEASIESQLKGGSQVDSNENVGKGKRRTHEPFFAAKVTIKHFTGLFKILNSFSMHLNVLLVSINNGLDSLNFAENGRICETDPLVDLGLHKG